MSSQLDLTLTFLMEMLWTLCKKEGASSRFELTLKSRLGKLGHKVKYDTYIFLKFR